MRPVEPIRCTDLFAPLDGELIRLLRGLAPEDWDRPTVCREWTVKDIAAHLLDGNVRRLSLQRDGHSGATPDEPVTSYRDLLDSSTASMLPG